MQVLGSDLEHYHSKLQPTPASFSASNTLIPLRAGTSYDRASVGLCVHDPWNWTAEHDVCHRATASVVSRLGNLAW